MKTTSEAAKAAGVPLATLQAWITTGVISAPPVQPGRGAGVRLWTEAQIEQIRKMRKLRQSSAFLKERSARQAATIRKTLAPEEARERMSTAAAEAWTPERHAQASAAITASWTKKGVRRKRISGIKKAWTDERREAKRTEMELIMADPVQNELRLVGVRKANADPARKALRIANLTKANATPAGRRRRIRNLKKTTSKKTESGRAACERRSVRLKKMWADFRDGKAALAASAKPSKGLGAPRMDERHKRAAELRRLDPVKWTWKKIAEVVDPNFAKSDRAALASEHTVRVQTQRWMKSHPQTGASHDEPKALLDDRSSEGRGRAPGDTAELGQNQEDLGPAHSAPSQQGREALDGRPEEPDSDTAR
jgi:DNA-binding transcriptional MerR regulator